MMNYILDDAGNPVPEPDILRWAMWYENADRTVGRMTFPFSGETITVSTVFLAIDHNFLSRGAPILYETMVFASDAMIRRLSELSESDDCSIVARFLGAVDIQKRYRTRAEAEQGHASMCAFIDTCLNNDLLTTQEGGM